MSPHCEMVVVGVFSAVWLVTGHEAPSRRHPCLSGVLRRHTMCPWPPGQGGLGLWAWRSLSLWLHVQMCLMVSRCSPFLPLGGQRQLQAASAQGLPG